MVTTVAYTAKAQKMNKLLYLLLSMTMSCSAAPQMCFDKAGHDYGIDPLLLMSISIKESRLQPGAINKANRNGSEDVCGMQVNSSHYGKLREFNITRSDLLNDPCICVYTGAWVLAHNFRSYGKNWDSVGMYNTGPAKKLIAQRRSYAQSVKNIYRVLLARRDILEQRSALQKKEELAKRDTSSLPVQD